MCPVGKTQHPVSTHSPHLFPTDPKPLMCSSKATGDPWLTDGSYLDGSGFARISFEKQSSHTKRFDQELRLVSYNGIIFFLKQEARLTLCPTFSLMLALPCPLPVHLS